MNEPALESTEDRDAEAPAELRWDVAVACAVFLAYLFTASRVSENVQTAGVIAVLAAIVFLARGGVPWLPWAATCALLAAGILARPLDVPNHHFMLTYTAAALALSLSAPKGRQGRTLRTNARWLIVALVGIATSQRLLQPTFVDGSYLGYEIARGGFAGPVLRAVEPSGSILRANNEAISEFRQMYPGSADDITLEPPVPTVPLWAYAFVATILAIELWICLLFLGWPQAVLTHLSLWAFAVTLCVLRQECTFISVVTVLGMMSCEPRHKRLRAGYAAFAILFAALVLKTLNDGG